MAFTGFDVCPQYKLRDYIGYIPRDYLVIK